MIHIFVSRVSGFVLVTVDVTVDDSVVGATVTAQVTWNAGVLGVQFEKGSKRNCSILDNNDAPPSLLFCSKSCANCNGNA